MKKPKRPKYYGLWNNIKTRCYNQNNSRYKYYGARGITIYEEWVNDYVEFERYIECLGEKPEGYSLDRVHNDLGYEPMNLRWASPKQQSENRRELPNSTGLKYATKNGNTYTSQVKVDGVIHYLGSFKTAQEAHDEGIRYTSKLR